MTELTPIPGSEAVLNDDEADLVRRLAEARQHRGEWEKVEKALRTEVMQIVQGQGAQAAITASGAPLVRISTSTRRTVDSKKLEALYPEVYDDNIALHADGLKSLAVHESDVRELLRSTLPFGTTSGKRTIQQLVRVPAPFPTCATPTPTWR